MAHLEAECARLSETATQIARQNFTIALQSFTDKKAKSKPGEKEDGGFTRYVDQIHAAEEMLSVHGVNMTDDEKKELFFMHFQPSSDRWQTLVTVWQQQTMPFAEILARGITEQQKLDLSSASADASGVRARPPVGGVRRLCNDDR